MQSANQPTDKPRTEIDPGNQVATLSSCDSLCALRWLATIGPDSPYGQALMRSLNAVRQHRGESVPQSREGSPVKRPAGAAVLVAAVVSYPWPTVYAMDSAFWSAFYAEDNRDFPGRVEVLVINHDRSGIVFSPDSTQIGYGTHTLVIDPEDRKVRVFSNLDAPESESSRDWRDVQEKLSELGVRTLIEVPEEQSDSVFCAEGAF
jgi:hypothetical protein